MGSGEGGSVVLWGCVHRGATNRIIVFEAIGVLHDIPQEFREPTAKPAKKLWQTKKHNQSWSELNVRDHERSFIDGVTCGSEEKKEKKIRAKAVSQR